MSDAPAELSARGAAPDRLDVARRSVALRLRRVAAGAAHVAHGARLLVSDRALLRAAALPTALTIAGSTLLALLVVLQREDAGPPWRAFAVAFVAVSSLPPTLLQRAWVRVGLEARRALGAAPGAPERPGEGFVAGLVREGWKSVLQAAAVTAGLAPVYLVLILVPGRRLTVPALGAAWAGYWLLLDALELPVELERGKLGAGPRTWFERLLRRIGHVRGLCFFRPGGKLLGRCARPWRHPARLTERFPWECLGFGVAALGLLAVPVVNAFFRAAVITAATSLVASVRSGGAPADASGGGAAAATTPSYNPRMLQLRRAEPRDVPEIAALVRELATYEELAHEVVATEADFLRDGFSEPRRFTVELALWDGAVAGFALWFNDYSTFLGRPGLYLEDLFVRPPFRGRGIGKALLARLAQVALEEGYPRFQWQVLDWNAPSIAFYRGLGAVSHPEWQAMRVTGEALRRLAAAAPGPARR